MTTVEYEFGQWIPPIPSTNIMDRFGSDNTVLIHMAAMAINIEALNGADFIERWCNKYL